MPPPLVTFFRDVLPVPSAPMQCACAELLLRFGIKVAGRQKVSSYCCLRRRLLTGLFTHSSVFRSVLPREAVVGGGFLGSSNR